MTTNSANYSDYIYINGVEQPANAIVPFIQVFPCSSSGATNTVYHSWEDFQNGPQTNRDSFFAVTLTCGLLPANGPPPSSVALIR